MKNNICLIGMPSCGKSTVGVLLAKAARLMFIDTDLLIQQEQGSHLWELIEQKGLGEFVLIEQQVICGLDCEGACISTGGSAVYSKKAMEHLRAMSTIVFIDVPLAEIERRIADIRGRGVVIRQGQTLAELYAERRPLYLKYAHKVLDADGLSVEETLEAILRLINNE